MTTAAAPAPGPVREEAAARVGRLFARHGRMVYGICRAMLRDVHEAEDATQQVFLSAYKALLGGANVRDQAGWLAAIARNECRARIAAGMRLPLSVAEESLEALPAAGDEQHRQAQLAEIRDALEALPQRQREAVVLRYLYGLRYGEVAKALGLSRPATEALLFRARRALRVSLRPVSGVLVVPAVVREELALALPGFEASGASVAAGAGLAGGVLAKLAAGPTGVKVATTAAAVATVGTVGTMSSDRSARAERPAPLVVEVRETDETGGGAEDADEDEARSGRGSDDERDDRSGPSDGADDDREDRSGDDDADDAAGREFQRGGSDSGSSDDDSGLGGGAVDLDNDDSGPESGDSRDDERSGSSGSGSSGSRDGEERTVTDD